MNMKYWHMIVASTAAIVGFLGCGNLPEFEGYDIDPETCAGDQGELNGNWTISGTGSRSSCWTDSLNTSELKILSDPLPLRYDSELKELSVDPNFGRAVGFQVSDANVNRACVSFVTSEKIGDQSVTYSWDGEFASDDTIKGTFRGTGPDACSASGNFEMKRL